MTQIPIDAPAGTTPEERSPKHSAIPKAKPVIGLAHRALRAATRNDHALIDRMLLAFDLNRAEDYRLFLNAHFVALRTLRAYWREQDCEDFEQMLGLIHTDLQTLGSMINALPAPPRTPESAFKGLGVAYVIRNSRLGASRLRRDVAIGFPMAYLNFMPALTWAEFLLELNAISEDPSGTCEAIGASRSTLKIFVTEFERPYPALQRHLLMKSRPGAFSSFMVRRTPRA